MTPGPWPHSPSPASGSSYLLKPKGSQNPNGGVTPSSWQGITCPFLSPKFGDGTTSIYHKEWYFTMNYHVQMLLSLSPSLCLSLSLYICLYIYICIIPLKFHGHCFWFNPIFKCFSHVDCIYIYKHMLYIYIYTPAVVLLQVIISAVRKGM